MQDCKCKIKLDSIIITEGKERLNALKQQEVNLPPSFCASCTPQLWPACKFGIHVCNMGIPVLSDLFCQGSLYFCQITQVRSGIVAVWSAP